MKLSRLLLLMALSVTMIVSYGCGEDKTIYETGTTNSTTTTTGTTTTTTGATDGASLFQANCSKCHKTASDPYGVKWSTLTSIPANMQFDLSDAQLKTLVSYFATLQ